MEVLDYRQRQREEVDRQRQEEADKNATHAAAMQIRYSIQLVFSPKKIGELLKGGQDTNLHTLFSALKEGAEKAISVLQGWDWAVKDAVFEALDTQRGDSGIVRGNFQL